MITLVKGRLWFIPILALSLQFCLAQAPSGPVSFTFNNTPGTAVYDLNGTYNIEQDMQGPGGTAVPIIISEMPLAHDAQGRLRGEGEIQVMIGSSSFVAARYTAHGQVSGGGNNPTRMRLSVRLNGRGVIAGLETGFSISVSYNFEVDPGTLTLIGTSRGHADLGRAGAGSIKSDVVLPLQPGVDGTWTAQMDILPTTRLGGTASIVLSNGRSLPTKLTGTFSARTGLARTRLSGIVSGWDNGRGTTLNLTFFPGASQPATANGRIMGQKVLVAQ